MKAHDFFDSKLKHFETNYSSTIATKSRKFYDECFEFSGHQNIAFIIVAHPTDSLPAFLYGLSKYGDVAGMIMKGRRISDDFQRMESVFFRDIKAQYQEIIIDHLDRDLLEDESLSHKLLVRHYFGKLVLSYPSYKFVILDHGGYFAKSLKTILSYHKDSIVGLVEHTWNGEQRLKEILVSNQRAQFPFPVASIARSSLKSYENTKVGESMIHAIAHVYEEGFREDISFLQKILIIGYGEMGRGVAAAWLASHVDAKTEMYICDLDPEKLAKAIKDFPYIPKANFICNWVDASEVLHPVAKVADLIFLATDKKIVTKHRLLQMKDKACLAGVTSSDDLFDQDVFAADGFVLEESETTSIVGRYNHFDSAGKIDKTLYLAANGKTVNFLFDSTKHPILSAIFGLVIKNALALISLDAQAKAKHLAEIVYAPVLVEEEIKEKFKAVFGASVLPNIDSSIAALRRIYGTTLDRAVNKIGLYIEKVCASYTFTVADSNYIDLQGFNIASADKTSLLPLLFERIDLHFAQAVYFIRGGAGAGKTTLLLKLLQKIWQQYLHTGVLKIIPIYVDLKKYKNIESAIQVALKETIGLTPEEIDTIRQPDQDHQFVFLFDAIDESPINAFANVWHRNELLNWGDGGCVIVTCRDEFLIGKPYQAVLKSGLPDGLYFEYQINALVHDQVESYLKKSTEIQYFNTAVFEKIKSVFGSRKQFYHFFNTPLMLFILVSVFEYDSEYDDVFVFRERKSSHNLIKIKFFDALILCWYQAELSKALQPANYSIGQFKHFSQSLAYHMFASNQTQVSSQLSDIDLYDEFITQDERVESSKWQRFFAQNNQGASMRRRACPLVLDGGYYAFIHKKLQDYFVAGYLWEALKRASLEKIIDIWGIRFFYKDPMQTDIISFLVDRLTLDESYKTVIELLFRMVSQSKINAQAVLQESQMRIIIAASNAITVLSQAKVIFSGRDLSHIKIEFANCSGAIFHGANLKDASFSNVNFDKAYFGDSLAACVQKDCPQSLMEVDDTYDHVDEISINDVRGIYAVLLNHFSLEIYIKDMKTHQVQVVCRLKPLTKEVDNRQVLFNQIDFFQLSHCGDFLIVCLKEDIYVSANAKTNSFAVVVYKLDQLSADVSIITQPCYDYISPKHDHFMHMQKFVLCNQPESYVINLTVLSDRLLIYVCDFKNNRVHDVYECRVGFKDALQAREVSGEYSKFYSRVSDVALSGNNGLAIASAFKCAIAYLDLNVILDKRDSSKTLEALVVRNDDSLQGAHSIQFLDNKTLLSVGVFCHIIDIKTKHIIQKYGDIDIPEISPFPYPASHKFSITDDQRYFAIVDQFNCISIWDVRREKRIQLIEVSTVIFLKLVYRGNDVELVVVNNHGKFMRQSVPTNHFLTQVDVNYASLVQDIAVSAKHQKIFISRQHEQSAFKFSQGLPSYICFSGFGDYCVLESCSDLWLMADGRGVSYIDIPEGKYYCAAHLQQSKSIKAAALSPSGDYLVTLSARYAFDLAENDDHVVAVYHHSKCTIRSANIYDIFCVYTQEYSSKDAVEVIVSRLLQAQSLEETNSAPYVVFATDGSTKMTMWAKDDEHMNFCREFDYPFESPINLDSQVKDGVIEWWTDIDMHDYFVQNINVFPPIFTVSNRIEHRPIFYENMPKSRLKWGSNNQDLFILYDNGLVCQLNISRGEIKSVRDDGLFIDGSSSGEIPWFFCVSTKKDNRFRMPHDNKAAHALTIYCEGSDNPLSESALDFAVSSMKFHLIDNIAILLFGEKKMPFLKYCIFNTDNLSVSPLAFYNFFVFHRSISAMNASHKTLVAGFNNGAVSVYQILLNDGKLNLQLQWTSKPFSMESLTLPNASDNNSYQRLANNWNVALACIKSNDIDVALVQLELGERFALKILNNGNLNNKFIQRKTLLLKWRDNVWSQPALTHYKNQQWSDAHDNYVKALICYLALLLDAKTVLLATLHWNISSCLMKLQKFSMALEHVEEVMNIRRYLKSDEVLMQKTQDRIAQCQQQFFGQFRNSFSLSLSQRNNPMGVVGMARQQSFFNQVKNLHKGYSITDLPSCEDVINRVFHLSKARLYSKFQNTLDLYALGSKKGEAIARMCFQLMKRRYFEDEQFYRYALSKNSQLESLSHQTFIENRASLLSAGAWLALFVEFLFSDEHFAQFSMQTFMLLMMSQPCDVKLQFCRLGINRELVFYKPNDFIDIGLDYSPFAQTVHLLVLNQGGYALVDFQNNDDLGDNAIIYPSDLKFEDLIIRDTEKMRQIYMTL